MNVTVHAWEYTYIIVIVCACMQCIWSSPQGHTALPCCPAYLCVDAGNVPAISITLGLGIGKGLGNAMPLVLDTLKFDHVANSAVGCRKGRWMRREWGGKEEEEVSGICDIPCACMIIYNSKRHFRYISHTSHCGQQHNHDQRYSKHVFGTNTLIERSAMVEWQGMWACEYC